MSLRRSLTITPVMAGRSVKSLLSQAFEMSDSYISRLKRRENGILLNDTPAYTNARVKAGDVLSAAISDAPSITRPIPLPHSLDIIFEDTYMLVLNKPAGLAVHASTRAPGELCIENILAAILPPTCGMHPVSRLDKGTTGLMTVAKSGYMHELLKRRQHTPAFTKTYLAVCSPPPTPPKGRIDAPIGYAPGSRYMMATVSSGAPSLTDYETLQIEDGLALVRVMPVTGRTHQIRVHLASIGCPLLSDWLYGTVDTRITRPALHAERLHILHPLTGEALDLIAPLPMDMVALFTGALS